MPLDPTWQDIAIRLALTIVAGALIGFNREAHGHAAGLRTTLLVCLAASVAMILANVLLTTAGKNPGSFVQLDMMRLPLGILTGVGFIGGGAIFRRSSLVTGVTTAATLWIVTVIGLCFGSGAIELGAVSTALALVTLWFLKLVDLHTPRTQRATLTIRTNGAVPSAAEVRRLAEPLGCHVRVRESALDVARGEAVSRYDVRWRSRYDSDPPLQLLDLLQRKVPGAAVEWKSEVTD